MFVAQHDQELVSPEATHDVARIGGLHECHGGGEDGGVASLVPVGVVERLQTVEVDEEHRHGLT